MGSVVDRRRDFRIMLSLPPFRHVSPDYQNNGTL